MKHFFAFAFVLLTLTLFAQKGSVKGFIIDKANGEAISYATVKVEGTDFGAATDDKGFFNIPNLPEATYTLSISYVGYVTHKEDIEIKKGKTINLKVTLDQSTRELEGVEISGEKQKQRTETRVSVTSITPMEMKRLPTVGGEADIAQYLSILPGIISTGDQGGQVVIRGGTPIQTKFLLDGITVYNPFHSIGLFSTYETDIIKNVDVYTGGFPSQYGGRISAVVDVTTRDGNQKKFSGKISATPYVAHALLEIPIIKVKENGSTSAALILNAKVSYLEQAAKTLFKYTGKEGLPYTFYDVYGKFTLNSGKGLKLNISGFNFRDNVNFTAAKYGWNTFGVGANFLAVPKNSNLTFNTHLSYSEYEIKLTEADNLPRRSKIGGFDIGMDFVYYIKNGEFKYGLNVEGSRTEYEFYNQSRLKYEQNQNTTDLGAYLMIHKYVKRFVVEGGVRIQYYGNIGAFSPEPRLSMKFNVTEKFRIKFATGLYSQNFISTKSDRDVVNLFTGFLTGPDEIPQDAATAASTNLEDKDKYKDIRNMQRSVHAILGFEIDLPKNVTVNVEPYYKYFWHLFNINRYKQFTYDPNFLIEKGDAFGIDFMAKWEWKGLYVYGTYSLSWANRYDGLQSYHPHFDRRHNVNLLVAYTFGKKRDWEVSARWNFGSGFPFTKTQAFYEQIPFDNGVSTNYTGSNGYGSDKDNIGIIYEDKINGGRLPYYHRLDISAKKTFNIKDKAKIEISAGASNVYNRKNLFFVDRVKATTIYQLPILPTVGLAVTW